MAKKIKKVFWGALIISIIGIVIDIIVHTFLTTPNETTAYFITKFVFFFIASLIFLSVYSKQSYIQIIITGILVSALWGAYYNVFPSILGYVPYGIALSGVKFNFTDNNFLSGLLFGITHAGGFIIGALANKRI